jgi:type II secretory pathway pseudopilin PulG
MTDPSTGTGSTRGFTLAEIMVALVIGMIVMTAVLGVMISQLRRYELQTQTADASETVRGAAAFLGEQFRSVSAARGDLTNLNPFSVTVRAVQGNAVACAKDNTLPRYALDMPSGTFQSTIDDSVLAYSPSSGTWKSLKVAAVWTNPAAVGMAACAAPSTATPDLVIEVVPGDTAGIGIGSDMIAFRRTQYGIFQQGGRWWLGRRLMSADQYDRLTGPLMSPADSGLVFHYFDAAYAETADSSRVVQVQVVLRAQSYRRVRTGAGVAERRDSTAFAVAIRN